MTVAQRDRARASANRVRKDQAGVRRELRGLPGREARDRAAGLLEGLPARVGAVRVTGLLMMCRHVTDSKVSRLLYRAGIGRWDCRVRDLTDGQRARLAAGLRGLS